MEIWRDVVGYEDRYQVSDEGRVRSKPSHVRGKIRKIQPHPSGYSQLKLYRDNIGVNFFVHHLVATAFHWTEGRPRRQPQGHQQEKQLAFQS